MYGDFRRIPQGDGCGGCPYWVKVAPRTIPGGVPRARCTYLDVENDPLLNDSIKICDVDLPDHMLVRDD